MSDWDERMDESEELASESLWQTTEIRNTKPNWSSFGTSNLITSGCVPPSPASALAHGVRARHPASMFLHPGCDTCKVPRRSRGALQNC